RTSNWLKMWTKGETWLAYLFILPGLVGFLTFFAIPAVRGLLFSFTNADMVSEAQWIGTQNFENILKDENFWHSLAVTVQYVLLNIPLQTVLAIGLAVLMNRLTQNMLVRGVLVLPWLIPNVVVALLWLWMLDPQLGLINQILTTLGMDRVPFLGNPSSAMASIAGINIWRHVGYTALLLFAGLQTIPKEMYEAAAIDGATEVRTFFAVTLPLLRPVLVFVLITSIIGSFQIFDTIAITTKGGPVDATRVIYWYIYNFGFERFKMGYGSAVAVILFLILGTITIIQLRLSRANTSNLD
ncbi:MAG TPA: sugar ABC transporter permease, partial [Thermoflexales bacterium]|nr:sugar ABC transporter permease [Thermoflexales bacterium]